MSGRTLFNPRHELFSLFLFCHDLVTTGEMMVAISDVDYYATNWGRETFRRIRERYANMEVTDGVLQFTSLIADDELSEETRERLESGRKKFLNEKVDRHEVVASLRKYRKLRRLNELSEHINTALHQDEHLDPDQIIGDIDEHLAETKAGNADFKNWFHHLGSEFNLSPIIERIMSDEHRGFVPTGIKEFDDKNGGINYGAMMVIGGNTGGGKSLVAQNISQNMAMYEDVCMVPLEMTEVEMVSRMMSREGEVPIHRITGKTWNEEEKTAALDGLKAYHKKVKKQGNRYSIYRPEMDQTIEEIFSALHAYNYRVIVIDYISLLKGADGDDSWQKLGQIARAAKMYAAAHNKVVIILAQLSDEGQIRYARAILEHANNAFMFVATEHTKEQGILDVKQPKARNQDPSPFTLNVQYAIMKIEGSDASANVKDDDDEPEKRRSNKKGGDSTASKDNAGKGKRKSYLDGVENL